MILSELYCWECCGCCYKISDFPEENGFGFICTSVLSGARGNLCFVFAFKMDCEAVDGFGGEGAVV